MATLSRTKVKFISIAKWIGIFFLLIIVLTLLIKPLTRFKESIFPTPSAKPQVLFGKLPLVSFPSIENKHLNFTLNTVTGFLPTFNDQIKVYKIIKNKSTFGALQQAQSKVAKIGFIQKGDSLSEELYQWTDQGPLPRTLTINIFSSDFNLRTPYLTFPQMQVFSNLAEQKSTIDIASQFLSNMNLLPQDLDRTKTKTTNYSIQNNTLIPSTSVANTKIVRVDLFQKDQDSYPIFYENGEFSTINLFVGKVENRLTVVQANYSYKNVSSESSTYPIKTTKEAFAELQQGNTYVAKKPFNTENFSITDVILGYYVGNKSQDFLMPIFIFKKGDEFIAYVSAIRDEWINN